MLTFASITAELDCSIPIIFSKYSLSKIPNVPTPEYASTNKCFPLSFIKDNIVFFLPADSGIFPVLL